MYRSELLKGWLPSYVSDLDGYMTGRCSIFFQVGGIQIFFVSTVEELFSLYTTVCVSHPTSHAKIPALDSRENRSGRVAVLRATL